METKLKKVKMRFILPVFFGCLGSLVIYTLFVVRQGGFLPRFEKPAAEVGTEEAALEFFAETEAVRFFAGSESETVHFLAMNGTERGNVILESFRRPETRDSVIDFFEGICPSREIAGLILANAELYDIPPALAFALGWEESRLNSRAVNKNRDGSIDRGLFQLNNRSFPRLAVNAFFDPGLNALYGMSHLRHCLDTGGTEVAALAMYNAGTGRVTSTGTPKSTLDYISRILENRLKIEKRFLETEDIFQETEEDFSETVAEAKPERSRLLPLKPLAGVK